jgi:hypothetical protein
MAYGRQEEVKLSRCGLIAACFSFTSLIIISGCTSAPPLIIIKPEIIKPPVITDTLRADTVTDTVVIATEVVRQDTVILIKYYPADQKFYYKIKPDSIIVIDTVVHYIQVDRITETKDYIFLYGFIISVLIIVVISIIILIKKK